MKLKIGLLFFKAQVGLYNSFTKSLQYTTLGTLLGARDRKVKTVSDDLFS